ncbi:MAG: hypothetical protein K6G80_09330 [Treponema sp.]|nr:hypothetical protein [Treponema sp.]
MKNLSVFFLIAVIVTSSVSALSPVKLVPSAVPERGEYVMEITACDWGPSITKIVLNAGRMIPSDSVTPEAFSVDVTLNKVTGDDADALGFGMVTGSLEVTAAYVCDEKGMATGALKSPYVALETLYGPTVTDGDPFFHFPRSKSMSEICGLRIKSKALSLEITSRTAVVSPLAGQFSVDSISLYGVRKTVSLTYAWWLPENAAGRPAKIPLIVWFHGMGEGGENPYLPLFGAASANLISERIQRYFPDGAAVLVPQCSSGWLESTTPGAFGMNMWVQVDSKTVKDKITQPVTNLLGKVFVSGRRDKDEPIATVSQYTYVTDHLLRSFLDAHPEIDRARVYAGGCSAGGYMALNMCLSFPETFAAAFPVCEAFPDAKITDAQIAQLAALPLWFVHAKNDTTIPPEKYDMLTVARLEAQGAKDVHYTLFDDVHDTTGRFEQPPEDEDDPPTGLPYQYSGHSVWIYVLNDACFDGGESLFAWLSRQSR